MSEIRANTISDAAGTGPITLTGQSAAKAWVNFNGTGTVAIRDSLNVASLTDLGTGIYKVSFSSVFSSVGYSVVASSTNVVGGYPTDFLSALYMAVGSYNVQHFEAGTAYDPEFNNSQVMGDLA